MKLEIIDTNHSLPKQYYTHTFPCCCFPPLMFHLLLFISKKKRMKGSYIDNTHTHMCVDSRAGLIFINKRISRKVARTKRVIIMSYIQCILPSLSLFFYLIFLSQFSSFKSSRALVHYFSVDKFIFPTKRAARPLRERFSVLFLNTHTPLLLLPHHTPAISLMFYLEKKWNKNNSAAIYATTGERPIGHRLAPPAVVCLTKEKQTHKSLFQIIIIMRAPGYGVV